MLKDQNSKYKASSQPVSTESPKEADKSGGGAETHRESPTPLASEAQNGDQAKDAPDIRQDSAQRGVLGPGGSQVEAEARSPDPETKEKPDSETLTAQRDRAREEKAELLERFQRAQAEFDNFRKRLLREKEEAREYAAMDTIQSLLPIVDDFERALNAPGLNAEFREGLDLIYKRIFEVFTRVGLKPVEENGKFDPHLHHAVEKAPAESDEQDQQILEVYQRGYHFKDRLLRPAMVKVAVKE